MSGVHDPAHEVYAPPSEAERRASASFRVRFDEVAPDGAIRASSYLRYAQDLAWRHSEARGFGRDWYAELGLAWVVRGIDLEIVGPVDDGDTLIGTTEVIAGRRVMARRRVAFRRVGPEGDGPTVATILTDWVLTTAEGHPTRVPEAFPISFAVPMDGFAPTRVDLDPPPDPPVIDRFAVRRHDLDPIGHANNAVFFDWVDEAVLAAGGEAAIAAIPRRYRAEYLRPAGPGAVLGSAAWSSGDGWACRLTDTSGAPLLVARLGP
jgi:acyl-ACP thioesterase